MDDSVLDQIIRAAGANEGYEVRHFRLYRQTKRGTLQRVDVEVLDEGRAGQTRYSVYAKSEDGKLAAGNPAPSLQVAIAIVHWGELG